MHLYDEHAVTIGVYDDYAAFVSSDELEYVYLCEECAEERGVDVTHLSTTTAGDWACCEDCGSPNRTEEEEEEYEEQYQ